VRFWTEERLDYYRKRAHRKVRSGYLAAKHHARLNTWLGVPVVVTSAIVGTTIFATLSKEPVEWKIVTGLLSVAAAVLAALQTFFRHAEASEKHRAAAGNYAALFRSFDILRLRIATEGAARGGAIQGQEGLVREWDKIERESPDVPDRLYGQAVREERADPEAA
jgi:hypothetical protein